MPIQQWVRHNVIFAFVAAAAVVFLSTASHPRLVDATTDDGGSGTHCNCVGCDWTAWQTLATDASPAGGGGTYSCGARVAWLQATLGLTEEDACTRVGGQEFPTVCGRCDTRTCVAPQPTRCGGCTECADVWDVMADDHSCGARITWLQTTNDLPLDQHRTETDACAEVATQFPSWCGACNPATCGNDDDDDDNNNDDNSNDNNPTTSPPTTAPVPPPPSSPPPITVTTTDSPTLPPTIAAAAPSLSPSFTATTTTAPIPDPNPDHTQRPDICGFGPLIQCTFDQLDLMPPQNIRQSLLNLPPISDSGNNAFLDVTFSSSSSSNSNSRANTGQGRPIPTSKWWTNMIGPDPNNIAGSVMYPVYSHPFRLIFNAPDGKDYGLHVCYSADYRVILPNAQNGVPKGYFHGIASDWIFSATDFGDASSGDEPPPMVEIVDWDDAGLGFSVEMTSVATTAGGLLTTDIVVGMPFVTARYQGLTPKLSTIHAILTINGVNVDPAATNASYSSTKFVVTNNKGQTWVIYASESITLTSIGSHPGSHLEATTSFDDVTLRIALLPDSVGDTIYDKYATCIVTGGSLDLMDSYTYAFDWTTKGDCSNGLLHLGFHHQSEVLNMDNVDPVQGLALSSATRGPMQAYATQVGQPLRWILSEPDEVPVDGFFPPRNPVASLIDEFDVLNILRDEIDQDFVLDGGSYYFTGKDAQKYATMCLLASDPNVNTDSALLDTCVSKLQDALDILLSNQMAFPLVYDEVYRGISSSGGFYLNDINADFGNTVYNDHHFHYGYWIFAGAAIKQLSPNWNRMAELDAIIDLFLRDTINADSIADPDFPTWRHFDWFAGHSSSHGLVPFFDGKDQESTSEEMNFHYSVYLWGKVSAIPEMESLGKLAMKICARSVGQYLLMEDSNTIHPEIVGNKVVGIFFENKVDYTTWFGANREYMHGIQMIPVSPANELLRTETFVQEEWDTVLQNINIITSPESHRNSGWQSLLYTNYAVIDAVAAMQNLSVATMDGGLSRAWALYFAATRPNIDTQGGGGITRSSQLAAQNVEGDDLAASSSATVEVTLILVGTACLGFVAGAVAFMV